MTDTRDPRPAGSSPSASPNLARVAVGIAIVFIGIAAVAGLIARQSRQASARVSATIDALQKDLDSVRNQVNTLAQDSERTAVLSLSDGGYFPVRTNAGTLLIAVADIEPVENALRVHLRVGNPHAMTYVGFTLAFAWDKGNGQQAFREPLEPGTWVVVPVTLAPADPASTRSLTITSASVDEIAAAVPGR